MPIRAEYDDLFFYMPSFILAERMEEAGEVFEGKALGTAKIADMEIAKGLHHLKGIMDPAALAQERKKGATVGKRKLKEVQDRTKQALMQHIVAFQAQTLSEKELRKESTRVMKRAWRDVFLAGVRAGGYPGMGAGKGKPLVKLGADDDKWLKSAMQHEMRFLNGFLKAVIDETWKMPLERRSQMYVNALTSFYESARVISLPPNVVIKWVGPGDKKTCASCEYLFENNPYTKKNLPLTPRGGGTICLTNCRDRLFIRRVAPEEAIIKEQQAKYVRSGHIRNLRSIKRTGTYKKK